MSLLGIFIIYIAGTVFGFVLGYKYSKELVLDFVVKFEGYKVMVKAPEKCPLNIFDIITKNIRERVIKEFDEGIIRERENLIRQENK